MIALLLSIATLHSAEDTPGAVARAVVVSVVDKSGRMVPDLTAAEVTVKENGQVRAVKRVERDPRPLAAAVLLDSSASLGVLFRNDLVDPVMDFLEGLPEGTDRTLMTIGTPPTVVDLTDPPQARAVLKAKVPFGKVSLYDAVADASGRLGQKKGTRRVIIVITNESFETDDQALAIEAIAKAAPLVLVIQFGVVGAFQPDLDHIVKWTGGRYEPIAAPSGVAKILQRLTPEIEAPWRVIYEASTVAEKRAVEVKVARKGTKVRLQLGGAAQ